MKACADRANLLSPPSGPVDFAKGSIGHKHNFGNMKERMIGIFWYRRANALLLLASRTPAPAWTHPARHKKPPFAQFILPKQPIPHGSILKKFDLICLRGGLWSKGEFLNKYMILMDNLSFFGTKNGFDRSFLNIRA